MLQKRPDNSSGCVSVCMEKTATTVDVSSAEPQGTFTRLSRAKDTRGHAGRLNTGEGAGTDTHTPTALIKTTGPSSCQGFPPAARRSPGREPWRSPSDLCDSRRPGVRGRSGGPQHLPPAVRTPYPPLHTPGPTHPAESPCSSPPRLTKALDYFFSSQALLSSLTHFWGFFW